MPGRLAKGKPDTVTVRNERVMRLKDELNKILSLVVDSREALTRELELAESPYKKEKESITTNYLKKLRELTVMFRELTASRIALDKAERTLERDMTPADAKAAVQEFILSLPARERGLFIKRLTRLHNEHVTTTGLPPRADEPIIIGLSMDELLGTDASGQED
jgi:hypothetical protein